MWNDDTNRTFAEFLCEPKISYEIRMNRSFDSFYDSVYSQVDILTLLSDFYKFICEPEECLSGYGTYSATTSRLVYKDYKQLIKLKSINKGSLVIEIVAGVSSGLILMFVDKLLKSIGSSNDMIQITNITNNNYIYIDTNVINIPQSLQQEKYLQGNKFLYGDYIDDTIEKINCGDSVENAVGQLFETLYEQGIINVPPIYDSRGYKVTVNDIGRFLDIRT